jgi:hypothetical protein
MIRGGSGAATTPSSSHDLQARFSRSVTCTKYCAGSTPTTPIAGRSAARWRDRTSRSDACAAAPPATGSSTPHTVTCSHTHQACCGSPYTAALPVAFLVVREVRRGKKKTSAEWTLPEDGRSHSRCLVNRRIASSMQAFCAVFMRCFVGCSVLLLYPCGTIAAVWFARGRFRPEAAPVLPNSSPSCLAHPAMQASESGLPPIISNTSIARFRPRPVASDGCVVRWRRERGGRARDRTANGRAPDHTDH